MLPLGIQFRLGVGLGLGDQFEVVEDIVREVSGDPLPVGGGRGLGLGC